jgi:hypothetical protein
MKPVLQALVLAERVYTDNPSGKKIIAGTFNEIRFAKFEATPIELPDGRMGQTIPTVPGGIDMGSPMAYVSLTDVVDATSVSLQMVNMNKNEVIFKIDIAIRNNDRLATIEIVAPLPPIGNLSKGKELGRSISFGETKYLDRTAF